MFLVQWRRCGDVFWHNWCLTDFASAVAMVRRFYGDFEGRVVGVNVDNGEG